MRARRRTPGLCLWTCLAATLVSPLGAHAGNELEVIQTAAAPCNPYGGGTAIAVSPDGLHVYEGGFAVSDAARVFASTRNPGTGVLTLVQTIEDGDGGAALTGSVTDIVPSPDGAHVYVLVGAGAAGARLNVFSRDGGTGALTFVEVETPSSFPLTGTRALDISPDGAHLYALTSSALTVYARDAGTGALSHVEEYPFSLPGGVAVSPDGAHVYAARAFPSQIETYARDSLTGTLVFASSVAASPGRLAVSADGDNVYVVDSSAGVFTFGRNAGTGALTLIDSDLGGSIPALVQARGVGISVDGAQLYVGVRGGIVAFDRSAVDGSLALDATYEDSIFGPDGLESVRGVLVAPDDGHVYSIGEGTVSFARDAGTGALTWLSTAENEGDGRAVVATADGAHVYRVCSRAVSTMLRDGGTGTLAATGNVSLGMRIDSARVAVMSPDGEHLYVLQPHDYAPFETLGQLVVLDRDPPTGALTLSAGYPDNLFFVDFFDAMAPSPDGETLYVAAEDALAVLNRSAGTGALSFLEVQRDGENGVTGLQNPTGVAVSPDGAWVYVSTSLGPFLTGDGIVAFQRNTTTGRLTFDGLVGGNGGGGGPIESMLGLALTADGTSLYAWGNHALGLKGAVAAYARDTATGALAFVSALREDTDGGGDLDSPSWVALDPAGARVYAVGPLGPEVTVNVLRRDADTGALGYGSATPGVALASFPATAVVATSPGGEQLYGVREGGDVVVLGPRARCTASPAAGCAPANASGLKVLQKLGTRDLVGWKWKGAGPASVGDPLTSTDFALCVYDASGSPQPVLGSYVPPGGTCGTRPCWLASPTGFKYTDKVGAPDGVAKLKVTNGVATAKLVVKGKGASLPPLGLPYVTPVTVQLQAGNGECWEAAYAAPVLGDAGQFKATE